jgi:Tfp pilus assembly protein PilO
MILLQAVPPVPPAPPSIPFDPNLFASNVDAPAAVMITLLVMTAITIVLWPLARALARRLEGRGAVDAALRAEMEQLHHRLGEVDVMQGRIAELEERLDFTERLLAQAREPDRLQR